MTTILHYELNAAPRIDQYESLAFEEVHATLFDLLPALGATILDIGAGFGRDATWFAARGDDVRRRTFGRHAHACARAAPITA